MWIAQDARYALRMMRRSPGFTAVAVLSLALGIGVNTAVFSLIDTLMLRMLPVERPGQLVELLQKYPGEPRGNGFWTLESYQHFRDHNHVFSSLIAASPPARVTVRGPGLDTETVKGQYVVGNFFPDLGIKPAAGRIIQTEDDRAGAPAVAMVSWSYWKSRFNLDPAIVGRRIFVQDVPVTIAGVLPREFFGLQVGSSTDFWLPRSAALRSMGLILIGRLKPGVFIQQAASEMAVLYQFTIGERSRNSKDPQVRRLKIELAPAGAGLSNLRDLFGTPLVVLMTLVGLLLLIACTNVANLLLARGAARQKEMAIRVSLGASRLRLACQGFTESLLLSGLGSLLGILVAVRGADALVRLLTSGRPIIRLPQPFHLDVHADLRVLLFTAAIALLTGLLFGLAPAWTAFSSTPASTLGETRFRRLLGKGLVVAQVAFSVVLLSAAGLFVRDLANLKHRDLGFRRDHVLLVSLDPSHSGLSDERLSGAYQELLPALEGIPGVRSASLSAPTPLSGAGASGFATVEGFEEKPEDRRYISISWIAPRYFETLRTPLLAGRDFKPRDQTGARVAIVNQALARYYFAGRNPVGMHIALDHVTGGNNGQPYEIVGVAGDANYYEIREAAPRIVYLPAFQDGRVLAQNFVLRTSIDPNAVAADVRRTISAALKTVAVTRVTTLSDQVDASIVPERLIATLSSVFGALGAVLAAIGLYGLLAYTVARRVTEIGIRIALGATRKRVLGMVLSDAFRMVAAGFAIGIPLALAGTNIAVHLIPDLPANGAWPIAFAAAGMLLVALAAAFVPASRAAAVDPMEALRHE